VVSVADMIRGNAPEWTVADTRRATAYVHEMLDTINNWDETAIRSRMQDLLRGDPVFAAVVYSMLPPPIRRMLDQSR
jgi:hypothetical protein